MHGPLFIVLTNSVTTGITRNQTQICYVRARQSYQLCPCEIAPRCSWTHGWSVCCKLQHAGKKLHTVPASTRVAWQDNILCQAPNSEMQCKPADSSTYSGKAAVLQGRCCKSRCYTATLRSLPLEVQVCEEHVGDRLRGQGHLANINPIVLHIPFVFKLSNPHCNSPAFYPASTVVGSGCPLSQLKQKSFSQHQGTLAGLPVGFGQTETNSTKHIILTEKRLSACLHTATLSVKAVHGIIASTDHMLVAWLPYLVHSL
jgi:hypothetical protein